MKKSVIKKSIKNQNLKFLMMALIGLVVLLAFVSSSTWFKGFFDFEEEGSKLKGELYNLAGKESNLVAYYDFEGDANDASGNGRDGTNMGEVTFVGGKIGQAGEFDGSNYIDLGNDNAFKLQDHTISMWVKKNVNGQYLAFVGLHVQSSKPDLSGVILRFDNTNHLRYLLAKEDFIKDFWKEINTDETFTTNNWTHVAITKDGENLKLWVNGIKSKEKTVSSKIDFSTWDSKKTTIGAYWSDSDGMIARFSGLMDEVKIWNVALNASEIIEEYDRGAVVLCTEDWNCSVWSDCINDEQTRTCRDNNTCGTEVNKSNETQPCDSPCTENWICEEWSDCNMANEQIRTCRDDNTCGTTENKSELVQPCEFDGLISYYDFEGDAKDSENNNDGITRGNPTISATNLLLDGDGDYIEVSDASDHPFDLINNVTISLWFKANALTSGKSFLIHKGDEYHSTYSLWLDSGTNKLIFSSGEGYGTGYSSKEVSSTTPLVPNKWYHFTAIMNRAAGELKLYLNGVYKTKITTLSLAEAYSVDTPLYIGTSPESNTNSFNGFIDEVKIWNYVLNDQQIEDEYAFESSTYNPIDCTTDSNCSDSSACTINTCDSSLFTCNIIFNDAHCDDGLFCNGNETCASSGCINGSTNFISDGVRCSKDICDEVNNSIKHTPNNTYCADNFTCTEDICDINTSSNDGCLHKVNNSLCDSPEVCSISKGCFSSSCTGCEACEGTGSACTYNKCHSQCEIGSYC